MFFFEIVRNDATGVVAQRFFTFKGLVADVRRLTAAVTSHLTVFCTVSSAAGQLTASGTAL